MCITNIIIHGWHHHKPVCTCLGNLPFKPLSDGILGCIYYQSTPYIHLTLGSDKMFSADTRLQHVMDHLGIVRVSHTLHKMSHFKQSQSIYLSRMLNTLYSKFQNKQARTQMITSNTHWSGLAFLTCSTVLFVTGQHYNIKGKWI